MMGGPDDHVESALTDLVRDYDKHWSSLDFGRIADLWVRDEPSRSMSATNTRRR